MAGFAKRKTYGFDPGDDLDLIAPDERISSRAFSLWLLSGTAEKDPALEGDERPQRVEPSEADGSSEPVPEQNPDDVPKQKRPQERQNQRRTHNPEPSSEGEDYSDLVEISDISSILSAADQVPDIVGFDFTPATEKVAAQSDEDDGYDWASDYYGKDEVEAEEDEDILDDGYSVVNGQDALDSFFGDGDSRQEDARPRPSAQSKVRTTIKTPLASDFGEDDDEYDDDEPRPPHYVSLFEIDPNERPFSVRSLGRKTTHQMTTTLQRFLDGNINLGTQMSALWRGFPKAYGISVGRQRYSGFAMRPTRAILTGSDFKEVSHMSVAKVQSFDAFIQALADGEPYAIEFFGINPDDILYADSSAQAVLASADAFISKRCGQAAIAKVVDLIRLIGRPAEYDVAFGQDRRERAIRAIDLAKEDFTEAYGRFARIYVDVQNYEGKPTVMASMNLRDMPLSEMSDFSTTLADIARGYGMMAEVRGRSALRGEQLAYTMTEVIRILQTTSELLDGEGLNVFRDHKVHVLNGIMRGRLIGPDGRPTREFWEIVDEEQVRLEDALERTELPDDPDEKMIERLIASQNRRMILQDS